MNLLVDTNIIIYHANGDQQLSRHLHGNRLFISVITEMEVLSFSKMDNIEEQNLKKYLESVTIIGLSEQIKDEAIRLRRNNSIKLLDPIIAATSNEYGLTFFTADSDFRKIENFNFALYEH
ncbi:MAG: type II toxin-antitoxin system VapC family toxin [Balneolaceae bacterium]